MTKLRNEKKYNKEASLYLLNFINKTFYDIQKQHDSVKISNHFFIKGLILGIICNLAILLIDRLFFIEPHKIDMIFLFVCCLILILFMIWKTNSYNNINSKNYKKADNIINETLRDIDRVMKGIEISEEDIEKKYLTPNKT